jgi:hypothetical protein
MLNSAVVLKAEVLPLLSVASLWIKKWSPGRVATITPIYAYFNPPPPPGGQNNSYKWFLQSSLLYWSLYLYWFNIASLIFIKIKFLTIVCEVWISERTHSPLFLVHTKEEEEKEDDE